MLHDLRAFFLILFIRNFTDEGAKEILPELILKYEAAW